MSEEMSLEEMHEKFKAMYEQYQLGLLNEEEKKEMNKTAIKYWIEKNW